MVDRTSLGYSPAPLPPTEAERMAILEHLGLLDTPPEREFDTIVRMASHLLGCKIALVSLVDRDRQWFKAKTGLEVSQTPREVAFCAHAVAANDALVVPDATVDERFAQNPLVTGAPNVRFYAGVPLRAGQAEGEALPMGTLCVIDDQPRDFGPEELELLGELGELAEALMDARAATADALRLAEERGEALRKLDQTNRKLRQAERMANVGSWRLRLHDNQTEWSEQTYAIHGVPVGDGTPLTEAMEFYPMASRTIIEAAINRTIRTGEPFDFESDFITAQGQLRRVRSMAELELKDGQPSALIGVFQDITERYQMEQALRRTANTDALTGLASRGHFNHHLDERLAQITDRDAPMALLLIDLDNFKAVNDRCGHPAGDDLLRLMASRLQASYLEGSFAARLGGDEFVLMVSDRLLLADLPGLMQRLLQDLRHTVSNAIESVHVSATIGACWLEAGDENRSDLLHRADAALYEAKRVQRGTAKIDGLGRLIMPKAIRLSA
ncbi:sensor domain-containing diguanylate cyclase [Novosphingobium terrae]|uniref:sensor domain-containing diguanylate cyclase n=1 Tax=Novosphingobium terrae TaxID=2726189 RepID=UPI00197D62F0|nr:diguanylate cyclase [Novosphingobium terrae]